MYVENFVAYPEEFDTLSFWVLDVE